MEAFFIYFLKSAGIVLLFFVSYKLWLQKETFFSANRHYLLAGILGSLLLPFVVFTSYIYVEPIPVETLIYSDIPLPLNNTTPVAETQPFNWFNFIFNIYILGVVITLTHFLIQLFSLFKIISTGKKFFYNNFTLVEVNNNISPFSFFNYIVYNPNSFSKEELEIILNHEKAHGKQLHTADIIISQLFLIFQWCNPIAWFYKKSIQQNLEFLADKTAINTVKSRKDYQHTLLKASVSNYCTSITNNFYNSLIKKRIVMLNQSSSKKQNLLKYGFILPVLALFIMSFNTKTVEVIKETTDNTIIEKPVNETTPSLNEFTFAELTPKEDHVNKANVIAAKPSSSTKIMAKNAANDVLAKITKNTTKEELDQIEKDLEKKGMAFSYSSIDYNSANEITSIKIKYKDSNSGNSGSYHVSGDDNEPIKTIYIYTTESGGIGIGNTPNDKAHKEHMRVHEKHMKEHEERMKAHKAKIHEHTIKIEEHKEKANEVHIERMEAHKAKVYEHKLKMEAHNKKMKEEHQERMVEHEAKMKEHRARLKERMAKREEEMEVRLKERKERMEKRKAKILEERVERRIQDGDSVTVYRTVISKDDDSDSNVFVFDTTDDNTFVTEYSFSDDEDAFNMAYIIEKSTSNDLLNSFKEKLKQQNIDFKFSGIKRNSKGEITRIKLRLDNNKGSKTSSTYDTSPDGIPTIMLGQKGTKLMINSKN